ncbi:MAG: isochorismate synthase MenF [Acidimicrobiales bacterium]
MFRGRRHLHGSGRRAVLPAHDACGFSTAANALQLLRAVEHQDRQSRVLMGSVPFDPREPAHLVIPELVVEHDGRASDPPTSPPSTPTSVSPPDDPAYRAGVEQVLTEIRVGTVDKVVLARAAVVEAAESIDTGALLAAFTRRNPDGYAYHMPLADESVLVGASPELLAEVSGSTVRSHPLAGTCARETDPGRDDVVRRCLMDSAKDQREHAILVTDLEAGLGWLTTKLDVPAGPSLVATDRLWHLGTEVTGSLPAWVAALDVAYAVHPTAAVLGVPAPRALALIHALEPCRRGTFAGLVGWMDSSGEGEWAIALRCAAVTDRRALIYAGAGIVAGSTPDKEHDETAAKLGTALSALGDVATITDVRPARAAAEADGMVRT